MCYMYVEIFPDIHNQNLHEACFVTKFNLHFCPLLDDSFYFFLQHLISTPFFHSHLPVDSGVTLYIGIDIFVIVTVSIFFFFASFQLHLQNMPYFIFISIIVFVKMSHYSLLLFWIYLFSVSLVYFL